MKVIKAKKDFTLNGKDILEGDEIKETDIRLIAKLNENGFIEPLTRKEMVLLERELANKGGEK